MHQAMYSDTYWLEERFWWFVGMRRIGHRIMHAHIAAIALQSCNYIRHTAIA